MLPFGVPFAIGTVKAHSPSDSIRTAFPGFQDLRTQGRRCACSKGVDEIASARSDRQTGQRNIWTDQAPDNRYYRKRLNALKEATSEALSQNLYGTTFREEARTGDSRLPLRDGSESVPAVRPRPPTNRPLHRLAAPARQQRLAHDRVCELPGHRSFAFWFDPTPLSGLRPWNIVAELRQG